MSLANLHDFLTVAEAAQELRCHPDTITALIRRRELKAVKLGRAVRVVSESINALINRSNHGSAASQEAADVNA
jgi:excisionase family DNA binding protein